MPKLFLCVSRSACTSAHNLLGHTCCSVQILCWCCVRCSFVTMARCMQPAAGREGITAHSASSCSYLASACRPKAAAGSSSMHVSRWRRSKSGSAAPHGAQRRAMAMLRCRSVAAAAVAADGPLGPSPADEPSTSSSYSLKDTTVGVAWLLPAACEQVAGVEVAGGADRTRG